ncbi:hypothetical protein [Calothrix sp. PCC 7507]|uniref:hypothetical protein n=1 Tax=Calothrix sp. PCC 7507 TaxID=99598 RepID=UPI00029F3666|nr:hypothetical protein [Calothrix sp. PCC 7507]AFY34874.1 hypothetical protein Cal7507_4505 [Calothrix sp. PCC 7507]
MADQCKDTDIAIASLNKTIANLNNQFNSINKRLKDIENRLNSNNLQGNNSANLNSVNARLTRIEKDVEGLKTGLLRTLESFSEIEIIHQDISLAIHGLQTLVNPLVEYVSNILQFLGA